jgi:hypothetical protein
VHRLTGEGISYASWTAELLEGAGGFDMHQLLYRAYLQLIGRAQQDLGSPRQRR